MHTASVRQVHSASPDGSSSPARPVRAAREARLQVRSSILLPGVEAVPAFLAKLSFAHEAAQQGRGAIGVITEGRVKVLGDRQPYIEAHHVGETYRAHRMIVSQLHGAV